MPGHILLYACLTVFSLALSILVFSLFSCITIWIRLTLGFESVLVVSSSLWTDILLLSILYYSINKDNCSLYIGASWFVLIKLLDKFLVINSQLITFKFLIFKPIINSFFLSKFHNILPFIFPSNFLIYYGGIYFNCMALTLKNNCLQKSYYLTIVNFKILHLFLFIRLF